MDVRLTAMSALGGILLLMWLPELPPGPWVALAVTVMLWSALRVRLCRWLMPAVLAFAWAWLCSAWGLAHILDPALEGQDIALVGRVASIPERHGEALRFLVSVDSLAGSSASAAGRPRQVRLSWYYARQAPRPGERWRFIVRLKRPHGYMDPGGFDYEGWLFQHGIGATGYVRHNQARRLEGAGWHDPVSRLRAHIARDIRHALPQAPFAGVLVALAVGDRSGISDAQWTVFRRTGTSHLVAISGLHIGLVAGLLFLLVRALWRRAPALGERFPAVIAGGLFALVGAAGYAALAGFGLPTRRALVMLAVITGALCLRRHSRPADVLALALLAVLTLDPFSVLSPGFWLSFGAVAIILYGIVGRRRPRRYCGWLWVQWVVSLGLLPLTVLFFQRGSLVGPLANVLAIPLFSFAIVPLALSGALLHACLPLLGTPLLKAAELVLAGLWPLLDSLSTLHFSQLTGAPSLTAVLVAVLGAVVLLAPRGLPGRWLGALMLLPLAFGAHRVIRNGAFRFTLLDVGQGLSAVVETAHHSLIYDTGPAFASGSNTAKLVVLPYLQRRAINRPDLIIVSHGDNDHAGGLTTLRAAFPGIPVLSGAKGRFRHVENCRRGLSWRWDHVDFRTLYPDPGAPRQGNNASCVLQISAAGGRVLLTGDIEASAENTLVRLEGAHLESDILVVPHHGSNSSSTAGFIHCVAPHFVLFPVGYRNRWGFPKPAVVARYRTTGARLFDSVHGGAITFRVRPRDGVRPIEQYRPAARHFWNAR